MTGRRFLGNRGCLAEIKVKEYKGKGMPTWEEIVEELWKETEEE